MFAGLRLEIAGRAAGGNAALCEGWPLTDP
jgi:hypothetical protein